MADYIFVRTDDLQPGDRLGRDIIVNNTVLLMEGVELTDANIKRIERLGLDQVAVAIKGEPVQAEAGTVAAVQFESVKDIPQPDFSDLSTEDEPSWMADATFNQEVETPRQLPPGEQLFSNMKHQIRDDAGLKPLISREVDAEMTKGVHSAFINSAIKHTMDLGSIEKIAKQLNGSLLESRDGYIAFDTMPRYIAYTDVARYGEALAARSIMSSKLVAFSADDSDTEMVPLDEQIQAHLALTNIFAMMPMNMTTGTVAGDSAKRDKVKAAVLKHYQWLRSQRFVSEKALELMLLRFERFDGSGFPFGLKGEVLPTVSQSWALGWQYSEQLYSSPDNSRVSARAAADGLVQQSGRVFGGAAVNKFLLKIGYYPIGSMVEMNDKRYGVVVRQNDRALLKPVIRIVNPGGDVGAEIDLTRHSDMFIARQVLEY